CCAAPATSIADRAGDDRSRPPGRDLPSIDDARSWLRAPVTPETARRSPRHAPERRRERARLCKSQFTRDGRDAVRWIDKQIFRARDPAPDMIAVRRHPETLLERPRKMIGAQPHDLRESDQAERRTEIGLDVIGHRLALPAAQSPARGAWRRRQPVAQRRVDRIAVAAYAPDDAAREQHGRIVGDGRNKPGFSRRRRRPDGVPPCRRRGYLHAFVSSMAPPACVTLPRFL